MQARVEAESFSGFAEPPISCPQKRGRIDEDRGYQVGVGQTDAKAVQTTSLNHSPHFAQLRHSHLGQEVQQCQRFGAPPQRAQRKLRNDGRVDHNLPFVQMLPHFFVSRTKVVNPNRRVRENQNGPSLRRGIFFNFGMVPSRDANRRALSRSIRALSASRISAVFSATPVNSWATRTKSSSSATVVLIAPMIALNDVMSRAFRHGSARRPADKSVRAPQAKSPTLASRAFD